MIGMVGRTGITGRGCQGPHNRWAPARRARTAVLRERKIMIDAVIAIGTLAVVLPLLRLELKRARAMDARDKGTLG